MVDVLRYMRGMLLLQDVGRAERRGQTSHLHSTIFLPFLHIERVKYKNNKKNISTEMFFEV